jgi:uncharacterized protein (DUF1800 family)
MLEKVAFSLISIVIMSFVTAPRVSRGEFPYKNAGLTERQAAAHLLNRFTFGPRPGQVDDIVKIGLEKWFNQQLDGKSNDKNIEKKLADFDTQHLSNPEIAKLYMRNGQAVRMAIKEGYIVKDSINKDKKEYKEALKEYMDSKGLKSEQELVRQTVNQKIVRAIYSENQLREVLTDFWFNHFNVSFTKNNCGLYIPVYERESIRPNVTADFDELLISTAQSPAMLMYLDNASSVSMKKGKKGLNENYAREIMELHTLGVDGGYTQKDVTETARVLTGWTIKEDEFFFGPNRHDNGEKIVLGKIFKPNGGYDDGVELLKMLAHHTSTAKFITRKLAVRFVSDNPPQNLLNKMADTFKKENGNIRMVLLTMVQSPEFWQQESIREKTKSPFELAVSAVRAMDGEVNAPQPLSAWITRMGQKIYYYQAPTGFPDKANFWINTGSLLNRMNFGLALSTGKVKGTTFDLLALNGNHEPESALQALKTYSKILLPERDVEKTIRRLTPLLNDPDLAEKIDRAARSDSSRSIHPKGEYGLAQVAGIVIGSPEFQRR